MKKAIKISFIMPVYRVEEYVKECIESILGCLREDDELLFVIRDFKDKSNEICREYAKRYQGLEVILQDKTGLSNARNCGLKRAKGDYVVFVDSDDYIKASYLEKRRQLLEQMDCEIEVLISDFIGIDDRGRQYFISHQIKESQNIMTREYFAEYSKGLDSYWNVWRYFYQREILKKENLFFLEGIRNEDVDFTTRVLLKTKKIGYYHEPYYCYRTRRKGALTTEIEKDHIRDLMRVLEINMENCKKEDSVISQCLKQKLIREYIWNLPFLYEVPKVQRKEVYDMFQKSQYLLKENKKRGSIAFWIDRLGIRGSGYLLHILKKIRRKMRKV